MALSSDLLSQFAKITNNQETAKKETTVYGTTVEYDGATYVKLDGSELLTPITTTSNVKNGERVTVTIKNHSAIVTGNVTSPSASSDDVDDLCDQISDFEIVIAEKIQADEAKFGELTADNATIKDTLTATNAVIETLTAENATITGKLTANEAEIESLKTTKLDAEIADIKYATIGSLEATDAKIHNLEVTYGEFEELTTNKFEAVDATIKDLDAKSITADELDANYANIDFANIEEAAIENLFAKSGMVDDLVMNEGAVTGTLVGVTIKGDLIEGGTVTADKLIIKGTDGLYYQLNTNGETIETSQTDYNSLNGSIITAKSITATKINVTDLVAFGATIGGFKITDNAIHTVVKVSVDNTTRGIYLDNDGQMAIGDSANYVKYHNYEGDKYKLEIAADTILFGSSRKNVEDTLNSFYTKEEADAAFKVNPDEIVATVSKSFVTKDEFSNMEVGGRNLLPLTKTFDDSVFTQNDANPYVWSSKVIDETYNGCSVRYCESTISGAYFASWDNVMTTNYGDTYTLSFWAKGSGSFIVTILNTDGPKVAKVVTSQGVIAETANVNNRATFTLSENWTRYWATYTFANTGDVDAPRGVLIYQSAGMYMCGVKFEKGNIATDWTPSPDDAAEVDVDAIVNGIEIGGRNLILKSDFSDQTSNDVIEFNPTERMVTFTSTVLSDTKGVYPVLSDYALGKLRNSIITFSGEYKITTALEYGTTNPWVGFQLGVKRDDTTGGNSQYCNWIGGTTAGTAVMDSWEKVTATYDITDYDFTSAAISMLFRDVIGSVSFRNLKIEFGNKATDWTPAPEDMATSSDVDNLNDRIEVNTTAISDLAVSAEGIAANVSRIEQSTTSSLESVNENITTLSQQVTAKMSAEDVTLVVKSELENGAKKVVTETGFIFDDVGLTVEKSGTEMKTQITEDGMTVYKNEEAVLIANNVGVDAVNLHATTYLIVGEHSRFENFGTDRTGCFWVKQ